MTYESARDLPTFVDLEGQFRALRLLRWILPRDQRAKVAGLGSELDRLAATVDDFYSRLGDRHWIMHDSMNVDAIRALLEAHAAPEDAESALIELYKDRETLRWMIQRCFGVPAMRPRLHLLDRAERDYRKGRYYSTVLVLIAVMDGFVNDFEPSVRRGLHARTAAELDAWDSAVGHHKGLTNILPVFQKSFKALREDEVFEVYRHGIVHGMVVNFDNEIVATKAWNYLFSVVDWARAETKRDEPVPPTTSWRETFAIIAENARNREALDAFTPHRLTPSDPEFALNPAYLAGSNYLGLWLRKNYGHMHDAISSLMRKNDGTGPAQIRDAFQAYPLGSFEILALDFTAAAVCIMTVRLTIDGDEYERPLRWIHEDGSGEVIALTRPGEWKLMSWGGFHIVNDS